MVRLHKCQPVTVEHVTDVDEESSVFRASEQEFLVQQFTKSALISPIVQFPDLLTSPVRTQLHLIGIAVFTDLLIDYRDDRKARFRKACRLLQTAQEEIYEPLLVASSNSYTYAPPRPSISPVPPSITKPR